MYIDMLCDIIFLMPVVNLAERIAEGILTTMDPRCTSMFLGHINESRNVIYMSEAQRRISPSNLISPYLGATRPSLGETHIAALHIYQVLKYPFIKIVSVSIMMNLDACQE